MREAAIPSVFSRVRVDVEPLTVLNDGSSLPRLDPNGFHSQLVPRLGMPLEKPLVKFGTLGPRPRFRQATTMAALAATPPPLLNVDVQSIRPISDFDAGHNASNAWTEHL